jgi:tetratricopeptide (TPR) repeat protein
VKAVQDFNYKVALASGLKHLQGGKLRQAEEQFRYLVSKFPGADGGHRGLARVQLELGDRAAALATLRDGAAALARASERALAIDLLREATALDPLDLSAHRRLAAALALAGDVSGAAQEYVRFTNAEIAAGDPDRARLEASYAMETLGEIPALHELARTVGLQLRTVRRLAPEPEAETVEADVEAPTREPGPVPMAPLTDAPWRMPAEPAQDPRLAAAAAWAASRPASMQERTTAEASIEAERPPGAQTEERSDEVEHVGRASGSPASEIGKGTRVDVLELEARATALIASRDATAGPTAVEAARALADSGRVHAASDLLLQCVAAGIAVHEAERELIGVAQALGRTELAAERERLLGTVASLG